MAGWRGISWFADTSAPTVPLTANAITTTYDKQAAGKIALLDGRTISRTRTIITREWIGLTQAAAAAAVDTMYANPITNAEFKAVMTHPTLNVWKVVENIDSAGAWS